MEGHGREIAPGLHRIEAPLGERFVACYVIAGTERSVLFDTGVARTPEASIVPYCRAAGIDIDGIGWAVVSHCDVDHMGGDAAIKKLLPGISLLAHAADARLIGDVEAIIEERYREFRDDHGVDIDAAMIEWCRESAAAAPVDVRVEGRRELDLGSRQVELLHTPGHSDGSISIWDPSSGAVLVSDAVMGESLHFADGRAAFPPTYRKPTPYLESIAAIEALESEWLLTAHEPVMERDMASEFLARSRDFAGSLEYAIEDQLASAPGALTTRQLIDSIAPRIGNWEPGAWLFLANGMVGHLEEMSQAGMVTVESGRPVRWRLRRSSDE